MIRGRSESCGRVSADRVSQGEPDERFQWKATNSIGAIVSVALMLQDLAIAQSQTTTTQIDKPNRVSVAYVATKDLVLQEFYGRLKNQMP